MAEGITPEPKLEVTSEYAEHTERKGLLPKFRVYEVMADYELPNGAMPANEGLLAPEPILRAALRVLHVAAYTTRNWTLGEDVVPRQQVNALWEAVHEVPDLIKRWPGDEDGLRELRKYLREYDKRWDFPKLQEIFDNELARFD